MGSDDCPFWTYEDLRDADYYEDMYAMIESYYDSLDRDDMDYPPTAWESGIYDDE